MAVLSDSQARSYAQAAGFSGEALDVIVAIAHAESGLNPTIDHTNTDGSIDRGILQINSAAWPQFSATECHDPTRAFQLGWIISKQGSNFTDWVTYKTGAYRQYLPSNFGPGPWSDAKAQQLWPWLVPFYPQAGQGRTTEVYHPPDEWGVDIKLPLHTTVTSLTYGKVTSTFYYGGGGVAVVESQIRNTGLVAVYYQHLDLVQVNVGDTVRVGDPIGLSGGQLSGGFHPATKQYSSGPHIEVGYNCRSGYSGYKPLGPSQDPRPWLLDLIQHGPPPNDLFGSGTGSGGGGAGGTVFTAVLDAFTNGAHGTGPAADDFASICADIDAHMQFSPLPGKVPNPQAGGNSIGGDVINGVANSGIWGWWPLPNPAGITNDIGGVASGIGSLAGGVVSFQQYVAWFFHNTEAMMLRAIVIFLGLTLITIALFTLMKPLIGGTLSTAASVAPAAVLAFS